MSGRFPIALHIMTLLSASAEVISSDYIAGSINVNPVLIRKELSHLIRQGLVKSQEGKKGGYSLNKPATQITLAAIYTAVKPEAILGKAKNQPNPACTVGKQINEHLNGLEQGIAQAMIDKLEHTSLAEFCNKFS